MIRSLPVATRLPPDRREGDGPSEAPAGRPVAPAGPVLGHVVEPGEQPEGQREPAAHARAGAGQEGLVPQGRNRGKCRGGQPEREDGRAEPRSPQVLRIGTARCRSRARPLPPNTSTRIAPAVKPATCAAQATPPPPICWEGPVKSCSTNQSPSTNTAGNGTMTKKAIVSTRALGNSTR